MKSPVGQGQGQVRGRSWTKAAWAGLLLGAAALCAFVLLLARKPEGPGGRSFFEKAFQSSLSAEAEGMAPEAAPGEAPDSTGKPRSLNDPLSAQGREPGAAGRSPRSLGDFLSALSRKLGISAGKSEGREEEAKTEGAQADPRLVVRRNPFPKRPVEEGGGVSGAGVETVMGGRTEGSAETASRTGAAGGGGGTGGSEAERDFRSGAGISAGGARRGGVETRTGPAHPTREGLGPRPGETGFNPQMGTSIQTGIRSAHAGASNTAGQGGAGKEPQGPEKQPGGGGGGGPLGGPRAKDGKAEAAGKEAAKDTEGEGNAKKGPQTVMYLGTDDPTLDSKKLFVDRCPEDHRAVPMQDGGGVCVKLREGEGTVLLAPSKNPLMPYKSVGACGAGMDAVVTNWPQAGDRTCKPGSGTGEAKPAKPEPPQRPFCISIKVPGNKYNPVCDCCYDGKTLGLIAGAGSCEPSLCAGSLR